MFFSFRVDVEADTLEQADQVMRERLQYDEPYGFEYTLNDPVFLGMGMDHPPMGVIEIGNNQLWTRESPSEIAELLNDDPMHFWVYVARGGNYERMKVNKNNVKTVRNYS